VTHLTRYDFCATLSLLGALEQESAGVARLLDAALHALASFVACDKARLADARESAARTTGTGEDPCIAAVPLTADDGHTVTVLLERCPPGFTPRDRERLALLQPHLAYLYRQAGLRDGRSVAPIAPRPAEPAGPPAPLTPREADVLHWLSYGKTDADIAALLAISKRTVHKHLEHIYVKLGVETRTAAVMAAQRLQSAVAPEAFTTLAHLGISARM